MIKVSALLPSYPSFTNPESFTLMRLLFSPIVTIVCTSEPIRGLLYSFLLFSTHHSSLLKTSRTMASLTYPSSHFLLYSRLRDISSFSAPNTHSHQIAHKISYNIPVQQHPQPSTPLVKPTHSSIQLLHTTPNNHPVYSKKKSEHPRIHSILLHSNSCQGALSGFHLALSKDDLTKRKKNKNKNKNKPHFYRSRTHFCPDLVSVGLPSYCLEVPKWVFTQIQGFSFLDFFEFLHHPYALLGRMEPYTYA